MPEVLRTDYLFQGKVVSVRLDDVRLEDGHVSKLEVVEHVQSMTVVAIDSEQRIVLVRQYRHPAGQELLETPAGCLDPGESAEDSVNRELAEEAGLRARKVTPIGGFYLAPGWATEYMHVFLAQDLYESHAEADEDERIEVVLLPIAEWEAKIAAGEITDCKSIAAWHLARAAGALE
jgi:ADP-ribose pyrophosphatase